MKVFIFLSFLQVNPKLVIFNTKITSQERQMIWEEKASRSSSPMDMSMEARLQRMIDEKGYNKKDPLSITEINLNEFGINVLGDFLSKVPRVEKLLLRGNQFCERLSKSCGGILSLRYLRVLDVRNNKLTDLEDLIFIVNQNIYLECLGVYSPPDENDDANYPKMSEQQVRQAIISRTPRLANIYCPFWEIDEKEITIDEIMNYWPLPETDKNVVVPTQQHSNKKLFRFQHCLFRKYIQAIQEFDLSRINIQSHTIVSLDLSNSKLEHVDFTDFVNLKKLSLRNNLINDHAFNSSGLYHTPIEQLDLQHNCIEHLETISKFIDEKMNTLNQLYLIYNPCLKKKDGPLITQIMSPAQLNVSLNDMEQVLLVNPSIVECSNEYISSRRRLISLLKSSRNPKWSFVLDGLYVSVSERCESISKQVTRHELETIRLELILNESKYIHANTTTSITLNFKGLILLNFEILTKFQNLIHLDLRGNSIKQLDRRLFKSLRKLHYLDLRDNDLSTSEQEGVLNVIGECHSLRVLYLQRCGRNMFLDPFEYHVRVFSTLGLLVSVDDVMNPFPLSKSQLLAIQYLENQYQLSPNALADVVIEMPIENHSQFWTILLALSCLVTLYDSKNKTIDSTNTMNNNNNNNTTTTSGITQVLLPGTTTTSGTTTTTTTTTGGGGGSGSAMTSISPQQVKMNNPVLTSANTTILPRINNTTSISGSSSNSSNSSTTTSIRPPPLRPPQQQQLPHNHTPDSNLHEPSPHLSPQIPNTHSNALANTSQFDLIGPKSIHFSSIHIPIQDYRFLLLSHVRTLEQVDGCQVHSNEKIHVSVEISKLRDLIDQKYSSLDTSLSMIRPVLTYSTVKKSILAQIKKEATTMYHVSQTRTTALHEDDRLVKGHSTINGVGGSVGGVHFSSSQSTVVVSDPLHSHADPLARPPSVRIDVPQSIDAPPTLMTCNLQKATTLLTTDKRSHLFLNDPYDPLVPFKFIQDNFDNISIIQYYRQLLNIRNQMGDLFEGFLNRIEMIIFSLQLFAICFSFTIPWPQYFTMVAKWLVLSVGSIDLLWNTFHVNNYYFKYSMEMLLPLLFLVIFLWNPSFDRLKVLFVKKLGWTLLSSILIMMTLVIIGTFLSLAVFPLSYNK